MNNYVAKLANSEWNVKELTQNEMFELEYYKVRDRNSFTPFGLTITKNRTIYVNKELCYPEFVRTLRHEFMHAWMQATANAFQENYNEEHICTMVEVSNSVIYEEVNRYLNYRKENEME